MRRRIALSLVARLVVGGLFAWAGFWKLTHTREFTGLVEWVATTGRIDAADLPFAAGVLARFELTVGLCLLVGLYLRPAFAVAGAALIAFTTALVSAAATTGGIESCGCFGAWVLDSGGVVWWTARNLILLGLATAAFRFGRPALTWDALLTRKREA